MSEHLEDVRTKLAIVSNSGEAAGLIDALGAVRNLLHDSGLTYEETRPLLELAGALLDHQRGKPHPLLAVIGNAKNRAPVLHGEFKAAVAAVVTLIAQRPTETLKSAIAMVSSCLTDAGIADPKVRTWHHEISNERCQDDVRESYRFHLKQMGILDDVGVAAALKTLRSVVHQKM